MRRNLLECERIEYATAIELGDAFICASQQQRDHWLGALGQAGRLDLDLLDRDPDGPTVDRRGALRVAGSATCRPLRGQSASEAGYCRKTPIILLWTGGLWNWSDPGLVLAGLRARKVDPGSDS